MHPLMSLSPRVWKPKMPNPEKAPEFTLPPTTKHVTRPAREISHELKNAFYSGVWDPKTAWRKRLLNSRDGDNYFKTRSTLTPEERELIDRALATLPITKLPPAVPTPKPLDTRRPPSPSLSAQEYIRQQQEKNAKKDAERARERAERMGDDSEIITRADLEFIELHKHPLPEAYKQARAREIAAWDLREQGASYRSLAQYFNCTVWSARHLALAGQHYLSRLKKLNVQLPDL